MGVGGNQRKHILAAKTSPTKAVRPESLGAVRQTHEAGEKESSGVGGSK